MGCRDSDKRYTIVRIPFRELYEQYQHLWLDDFTESGFLAIHYFDVDVDRYKLLEAKGFALTVAVKVNNEIVGYAVVITDKFLHSKSISFAKIDCIYIDKKHRSLKLVRAMFEFIENQMRLYRIRNIFICSMVKKSLGVLYKRLKYEPVETVYCKEL